MVVADNTSMPPEIVNDLLRVDRKILPVNLIYPANYPDEPAILLEEVIQPSTVLKVLDRMEEIQGGSVTATASGESQVVR